MAKVRISQTFFDLTDWKQAFQFWYEHLRFGYEMQMVLAPYEGEQGIWIEYKGCGTEKGDRVYLGDQVQQLEKKFLKKYS